uniref:Uncharacterized protein n=1 Tax=Anguilla anguilla TaxID=7936 RepID=A0A0E9SF19_ANGAN
MVCALATSNLASKCHFTLIIHFITGMFLCYETFLKHVFSVSYVGL